MKITAYNDELPLTLSGAAGIAVSNYSSTSIGSNTPLIESGAGSPGSGPQAAAWDHVHPAYSTGSNSDAFHVNEYNILENGLAGDGLTDDTDALNDLIVLASASYTRSCTIYFPPGSHTIIAGALQDTGDRNAQILLPDIGTSDEQITITFRGGNRPVMQASGPFPDPAGHSIIESTLTGATGDASVFGGGTYPTRHNAQIVVENLICLAPNNPTTTFWNLDTYQSGVLRGVLVCTENAYTASFTQPTHSNSYGVKLPHYGYSNYTEVNGLIVGGFYTGLLATDLATLIGIGFGVCIVAVEIPQMQHAMWIVNLHYAACQYGIKVTGQDVYVDVSLSAEHWYSGIGSSWQYTVADIDDPNDYMHGHVRWFAWTLNTGFPDHTFTVNGGANIAYEEIGELPDAGAIRGVVVTDAGSTGDVLTKTGAATATWSAPTGSGSGLLTVDPGTPTYDATGDGVVVTIASKWGYDGDGPYFDSVAVTTGEEGILVLDPETGSLAVVPYNP